MGSSHRTRSLDVQTTAEPRTDFDPAWLPSSAVTNRFVDAYFQLYNVSYPIVHEATFRKEIADQNRMTSASVPWRIVYYMVLAIGHWLSSEGGSLEQCPYYDAARSRVSMQILEAGLTRTVQGFLLMGNYLQKRDRPNTGYNLIGLAHRIAVGIGLHREKTTAGDIIKFERDRLLFWTVYCFDSGFSITTGRPIAAMDGFIDQSLPRNIDDQVRVLQWHVSRVMNTSNTAVNRNAISRPSCRPWLIIQQHIPRLSHNRV
jgi:transcriptional regulatory protein GAL4